MLKAMRTLMRFPGKSTFVTRYSRPYKITQRNRDIIMSPVNPHKYTLFWMHGLGDSAMGFFDFFNRKNAIVPTDITKVVLLTADEMPVTRYMGMVLNSWFDGVYDSQENVVWSEEDYSASCKRIWGHIQEEAKLLDNDFKHILVGGFSQGAALSFGLGMEFPEELGGLCACSGFLLNIVKLNESRKALPIFIYHGQADDRVPLPGAKKGYSRLQEGGYNIKFETEFGLGHWISEKEEKAMYKFFSNIIKP